MIENAINAIKKAISEFTGRDWTTGPDALLSLLEKGKLTTEFEGGHGWWTANGSFEAQDLNRRWRRLLTDVEEASEVTDDLIERAQEFVAAEDEYVAQRAALAADEGRRAMECLKAGDYDAALDHVMKADGYENEFGDDPSWCDAVKVVKALVEAQEVATEVSEILWVIECESGCHWLVSADDKEAATASWDGEPIARVRECDDRDEAEYLIAQGQSEVAEADLASYFD